MSDNIARIKKVLKHLESDNTNNTLESVLAKFDWPTELFFMTLVNQILQELANIEQKTKEYNINDYNTSFLYKMINLFCNVKYHHAITKQILDYVITKENIDLIFDKIISINNNNAKNGINEKEKMIDFNNHIVNLLLTIMNFKDKGIIDIIINNSNSSNLLNDLFSIFSKSEYCRNFLYNLEKHFIKYYPNVKSFKENINYIIYYFIQDLTNNIDNFCIIKDEINIILLIYKNDIEIIEETISILLMHIFVKFENKDENNFKDGIISLFKNCFNSIVFAEKKNNKDNKNEYNYKFMNFLFKIYKELIKNKLKKSYVLFFTFFFVSIEQDQIGAKKYKWLLQKTQFKNILNSLITLKDENLLTIFFTKLISISAPNNMSNNEDYYLPDEDIYFFISNLNNIVKEDKDKNILNVICSMIINIITVNKSIINTLFNKYKIINILISLINSDKYSDTIKNELIDLIEELLKMNHFKYQYDINIDIGKDINDINKRLYSILLFYENNINNLEKKLSDMITNMILLLNENVFESFFYYNDIMIQYIIDNQYSKINNINHEILSKINDIYAFASQKIIEHEIKNETNDMKGLEYSKIKIKIIDYLVKIMFELNMNSFRNILKDNKKYSDKIIFSENTLFLVIKNLISGKTKKEIFEHIFYNICLEKVINNNKDNNNNNNDNIDNRNNINNMDENCNDKTDNIKYPYYILKSSKILYMIISALFVNNDEETMILFYNKLEEIINFSDINIKLLNYDIISILIKTLLKSENQEIIEKIKKIISLISKYFDEKTLINYISKIYFICYNALINEINNDKKIEVVKDLFNILKFGLNSSKKCNCDYLTISNKQLLNPYIYNFFYITGLSKKNKIIYFNMNIKIYNNINNFNLASFFNPDNLSMLSFILDNNKNQLIISESLKKEKRIIKTITNINNYLKCDNNFHNISIVLNYLSYTINILIDSKEIKNEKDNNIKIILNNDCNFQFESFDIMIGYEKDYKSDNQNNISDISLIDISDILILNYDNEDDIDIINKQRQKISKDYDLLDTYIKENNRVIGELILAEFNLKNNNINYIKSVKINNISPYLQNNLSDKNNNLYNKYIGNISYKNPFINRDNKDNNNNKDINIFMISLNYKIEEYFSLNNIIENNISKTVIKSLLSKNFCFWENACKYHFVDFLIGFLFLLERKRKNIIKKEKESENNNNNNVNNEIDINENINIDNIINGNFNIENNNIENNIIENNNIINNDKLDNNFNNDIIIIILEIIFDLNKDMINYFFYENDILNIKIKHYFEKNIDIINNNKFIEQFISIFKMTKITNILESNMYQEYLFIILIKIFLNLIIFKKLNKEIHNIIILKTYSLLISITSIKNNINSQILYELLINLYNIILFHELSNDIIDNENNRTQLDIILLIIQKILNIYDENIKNKKDEGIKYYEKIIQYNEDIINFITDYDSNTQSHNVHQFIEENKSLLSDTFLENNLIKEQVIKLSELLIQFNNKQNHERLSFELIRGSNINFNLQIEMENDKKQMNKQCSFCCYLNIYFKLYFDFIYDDIKYDKYYKKFYRNLFLNFREFRNTIQNENNTFAWFLSSKESSHRTQNKFFIKENDIKIIQKVKTNKTPFNTYTYDFDKNQYNNLIKNFHKLFLYDNISNDSHFIRKIYGNLILKKNDLSDNIINCLYVKRIHKTLSLFILTKEYILILTNIFIDLDNKIHVVKNEPDKIIICLNKEDFKENFGNYVKNNNNTILNELFNQTNNVNNNNNNKKKNKLQFGLDKYYKFSVKKIYYKNISEMYKASHLQISNSIEIMTKNGEDHFIIFLSGQRDNIFNKILGYIGIATESNKKYLKSSSKLLGSNKYMPKMFNSFYMKYCPINYIENHEKETIYMHRNSIEKTKTKNKISCKELMNLTKNKKYQKSLVDINSFLGEINDLWIKNKISNYDYLMALNCLSGRSLNDLTQYYIFPWILKNFDHNILNWFNLSSYRDLSLPLFACEADLQQLKRKFELQDIEDKCHTGTFYSTAAFVSYFLTRQRPFTEIHLEIHGGQFDCPDRLFIGTRELSQISGKFQELIPGLYNLAESYINTNNFNFGKMQSNNIEVKDFNLPKWTKEDPRKFVLILRKILESEKVNKNLHLWIDLIFGYKQNGPEAIKNYNLFRSACYECDYQDIEDKIKDNELQGYLYEKQELGYTAKQIFRKPHKKKDNFEEFKEKQNLFFDYSSKLINIKVEKIINQNYLNNKDKIKFKKINDIFIFYNLFDIEDYLNYNFKGGISSLKSIMNALNGTDKSSNIKTNPLKVKKKLNDIENKNNNYIILGQNCQFIGKNIKRVIKHNKKYIQIIDIKFCIYSCFYLNEKSNISCLTTNEKGNKIFVGFEDGKILEYKILNTNKGKQNIIYPFMYLIQTNAESLINEKIFNLYLFYNDINFNNEKQNSNSYSTIILQKIIKNNFSLNNPHLPEEISLLKLNEEHDILIASTIKNLIYIISTSKNFKLMHIVDYLYEYPKKIKDIIFMTFTGEFLIYTSLSVYLFNINGVPLCELNLLNKENNNISKIKYVTACFIYDVILFTGHEDGSIIIWKVKNKNVFDNYTERISYIYNNNNSKSFLSEYNYNYDLYYYGNNNLDDFSNKKIIKEYELKRKFDLVSQIKIDEKVNIPIAFMKLSRDMNYMIVLDRNMNFYMVSNFNDYNLENSSNEKKSILKKDKKFSCVWCKKKVNSDYFRAIQIKSFSNFDINDIKDLELDVINDNILNNDDDKQKNYHIESFDAYNINRNKDKERTFLCEECEQKLVHTENYLYNY